MFKIAIKKRYLSYDIALVCWIMYSIIVGATTMPIPSMVENVWFMLCIVLLLYNFVKLKAIRKKYTYFFGALGALALSVVVSIVSGYPPLIAWVLLVICSTGVEHRHIVLVYLKCFLLLCTVIPIMALIGMIPNTVMDTVGNTGIRTAYGFTHPNAFSACVLVLIMCWTFLNWHRVRIIHMLAIDLIACVLLLLTDSLASFICIISMATLAMLERLLDKRGKMKIWYYVTFALLILCPVISYYLMVNFSMSDPTMLAVDLFTTGRVRTSNAFFKTYGWNLLGQNLLFDFQIRSKLLFVLDNSYVYILLRFGLLVTALYCIGIARELVLAVKNKDNFLIICILTFIIYGCFENYFFKTQFNFTLLFIASSCFRQKDNENRLLQNIKDL